MVAAFALARPLIAGTPGFLVLGLRRCFAAADRYARLVPWRTLWDPTAGFRGAPPDADRQALVHRLDDPFPTAEHQLPVA